MEKPKTNKKLRTIQITYPAPYSQSWNAEDNSAPVLVKNNFGRRTNFLFNPKRQIDSQKNWSQSYATVRGPDPTAPHLKYGVFSNRRSSSSRALPKAQPMKPASNRNIYAHNIIQARQSQEIANNRNLSKKKKDRKGPLTETPKFVFRTIDTRNTRQLTLSETMHIDIKPRKSILASPSFCPSPSFKVLTLNVPVPTIAAQSNARAAQTNTH